MTQKITIDQLARMIKEEFDGVNVEIKGMKENIKEAKEDLKEVKKEIKLRPTKKEMFKWADERIVDLELRTDRHDYLHLDELDKLPSQPEISRALVEHGLKKKAA